MFTPKDRRISPQFLAVNRSFMWIGFSTSGVGGIGTAVTTMSRWSQTMIMPLRRAYLNSSSRLWRSSLAMRLVLCLSTVLGLMTNIRAIS